MARKGHVQLWHKKQGREAGVNALAVRGSLKGGRSAGPSSKLSPAQTFLNNLKDQIKQAV